MSGALTKYLVAVTVRLNQASLEKVLVVCLKSFAFLYSSTLTEAKWGHVMRAELLCPVDAQIPVHSE